MLRCASYLVTAAYPSFIPRYSRALPATFLRGCLKIVKFMAFYEFIIFCVQKNVQPYHLVRYYKYGIISKTGKVSLFWEIIASGTVEEIAREEKSATGSFLKKMLSASFE